MAFEDNIKEKLRKSRELCPGLSEETYCLADYLSMRINSVRLEPVMLAGWFHLCLIEIICGNLKIRHEYINRNKGAILANAAYLIQIIDTITGPDFSKEFREICKKEFNFNPPRIGEVIEKDEPLFSFFPKK